MYVLSIKGRHPSIIVYIVGHLTLFQGLYGAGNDTHADVRTCTFALIFSCAHVGIREECSD